MIAVLNEKQQLFAIEYLTDFNATQAAIRAGYSEKTAYSQGPRLLKNVEVQEYLKNCRDEVKNGKIASQDEVLQQLTATLRREETESVVVVTKAKRSYYDEEGKKVTEEKEVPEVVEIPAKLSDVNKAAELLGKYHVLWTEKTKFEGEERVVIVDDIGGDQNA